MRGSFTLIELLIVLVIIGILVTLALPKFRDMKEKSKDPEALANLNIILDAEWDYRSATGDWTVGAGWTLSPVYLDLNDPNVISLMSRLGIQNPNLFAGRKFEYYFAWVNMPDNQYHHPPNSICFYAVSRSNLAYAVALLRAPYGATVLWKNDQYTGPNIGSPNWYRVN